MNLNVHALGATAAGNPMITGILFIVEGYCVAYYAGLLRRCATPGQPA